MKRVLLIVIPVALVLIILIMSGGCKFCPE